MKFSGDTRYGRADVPEQIWRGFRFWAGNSLKLVFSLIFCGGCLHAEAALSSISVTVSVPQQEDFSDLPITFQQFDPTLGKLSSVEIILTGTGELTQQFENRASTRNSARIRQTVTLSLTMADANKPLLSAKQTEKNKYKADPFDGDIDFGGTSGVTGIYDFTASDDEVLQTKKNLAMFTGTGLADMFLSSESRFHISSGKNASFAIDSLTGADITVIYNYITVPETAWVGGLAGTVGLVWALRSRTRTDV